MYPADLQMPGCYASAGDALQHRSFGGWFSYAVEDDVGRFCVVKYGVFHFLFALILGSMAAIATATCIFITLVFVRRRLKRWFGKNHEAEARKAQACAGITAVIPCYLPNEQYIIEETLEWLMNKVESPGPLSVIVVYNTPVDLPEIEERLQDLEKAEWPAGRSFRAERVMQSKSKAANLNYAMKLVQDPYVIIYDADHHPDRESLLLLWEKMQRKGVDCVQGSYYMRNLVQNQFGCAPLAFPCISRIIDAEFFTDWFFMKPVTKFFMGNGYFSGSNALWRTQVLASKKFSETAQTEDVDMAIQQLLDGRRIEFCPESRSGELAPMNLLGCWKQRLRWTIGWDETSLKHSGSFTSTGGLSCRARCGLVWTFLVRWATTVLAVGSVYVGFPLTLYWPLDDQHWGKAINYFGHICFIAGCGPWMFSTLEAIIQIPHRGWQGAVQVLFVFLVASPFGFGAFFCFNLLLQITSCCKLCTGSVKGWEVTQRAPSSLATKTSSSLPKAVSMDETRYEPSSDDGEKSSSADLEMGVEGERSASAASDVRDRSATSACSSLSGAQSPLEAAEQGSQSSSSAAAASAGALAREFGLDLREESTEVSL